MTKEEIFNQNIKLAYYLANKWRNSYPREIEDIQQVALLGLWKAIDKYDIHRDAKLSTYAGVVIQREIIIYLRENANKHSNTQSFEFLVTENITLEETLADKKKRNR